MPMVLWALLKKRCVILGVDLLLEQWWAKQPGITPRFHGFNANFVVGGDVLRTNFHAVFNLTSMMDYQHP